MLDFPAPEGPQSATTEPGSIVRETLKIRENKKGSQRGKILAAASTTTTTAKP